MEVVFCHSQGSCWLSALETKPQTHKGPESMQQCSSMGPEGTDDLQVTWRYVFCQKPSRSQKEAKAPANAPFLKLHGSEDLPRFAQKL